ncbi:GntR family transcriptional regulator [Ningiella sp. W23]|uniref:GntR family transcriptional regulator n=1 Tax=Ningiella sp. W23 TaxID=3023715 RepID=UPI003757B468
MDISNRRFYAEDDTIKDILLDQLNAQWQGSTPLYQQLASKLRQLILGGQVKSGEAIPSERLLQARTGASRVTIRKAVDLLIQEGLLFRRQGAGTFISERIEHKGEDITGFTDEMRNLGVDPSSIWLVKIYADSTDDEASALHIASGDAVCRLGRVRLSDNMPMGIENAVIPAQFLPDLASVNDSLYHALNEQGYAPVHGTQKITASIASPTEASLLSIREGDPVLRIERYTYLNDNTPLEYTRSVYRGDKYVFTSKLHSFGSGW